MLRLRLIGKGIWQIDIFSFLCSLVNQALYAPDLAGNGIDGIFDGPNALGGVVFLLEAKPLVVDSDYPIPYRSHALTD
jgi:hypothetical protein